MSAIPSQYPNNFESVKAAKQVFVGAYVNNHPHRLPVLRLTGSLDYEFDETAIATGLGAQKITVNVDFSALSEWTRVFNEKIPVVKNGPNQKVAPTNQGEFNVTQSLVRDFPDYSPHFWRFIFSIGDFFDSVKIGEQTVTNYQRDTDTDPWVFVDETVTDIEGEWSPSLSSLGGDPVSGGRGADNEENSVGISADGFSIYASLDPFEIFQSVVVYRLPWEDPWENESELFSDALADFITAQNAYYGGGWTGSTSMALEFS
jgi:hypothetical protein